MASAFELGRAADGLDMQANLLPERTAGERNDAADVLVGHEGIGKQKGFHLAHQALGFAKSLLGLAGIGQGEDGLKLGLNLAEELRNRFIFVLHVHTGLKCKVGAEAGPPRISIITN